jgi:hypothetical protein
MAHGWVSISLRVMTVLSRKDEVPYSCKAMYCAVRDAPSILTQ